MSVDWARLKAVVIESDDWGLCAWSPDEDAYQALADTPAWRSPAGRRYGRSTLEAAADVKQLTKPIKPGRYFADAYGNAGLEGGPVMVNLLQAAQQRGGFSSYKSNAYSGESSSISSEGVSFTNRSGKTVSWYPGLGSSTSE